MFTDIAFDPRLEENLRSSGLIEGTEIQQKVIPLVCAGDDLLISAPTGSGKTLAYLLPLLQELSSGKSASKQPKALILLPVRELAEQILQVFSRLSQGMAIEAVSLVGGEDFKLQEKRLASADLVVATPGRLLPHLENGSIALDRIELLVLDEADRMLEAGFKEAISSIVDNCSTERQTLLVSATLPNAVRRLAATLLQDAEWVKVGQVRQVNDKIEQAILLADDQTHKDKQLVWLLQNEAFTKAVVFSNSKTEAKRLDGFLRYHKFKAALLHGDVQQKGRFATVEGFRKGTTTVLVTTDLAARGLDIEGVDLVINMEMPRKGDLYLHRVGRTGRAEQVGKAFSMVDPSEWNLMSSIERYLKTRFRRKRIEGLIGHYQGPKKVKASGKAAGAKKRKKTNSKTSNKTAKKKAK